METTKIVLFKGKKIRKILYKNEWRFSVVDVIEALTDSDRPSVYWTAMKARVKDEGDFQLSTICRQLKLLAEDGKKRETDCADTEGIFRIIQSIPSPKAEPFKRWLAKVGYERVQEIENPEIATKRTKLLEKEIGKPVVSKNNFLPNRKLKKSGQTKLFCFSVCFGGFGKCADGARG